MKWLPLIGAVGGLLAVLALATVAFAVVRSNLQRTTTQLWKDEAEALKSRVGTLEDDNRRLSSDVQSAKEHAKDCEQRLNTLSALVTGQTGIEALSDHLEHWHQEVRKDFRSAIRKLDQLLGDKDAGTGSRSRSRTADR